MVTNIFNPEYIRDVGFPIAAYVAAFGIISTIMILIIKSQIKRQERCDTQYFTSINNTLDKYDKSMKDIHDELTNVVIEMRTVSTKIDTYINKLDQHFNNKNVTYVFREGKIDKIKNIIEKKDVIQDIEKKIQESRHNID